MKSGLKSLKDMNKEHQKQIIQFKFKHRKLFPNKSRSKVQNT